MPYSRIQQASNGLTAASLTITLGSTPIAGDLLVAWANSDATVTIGGSGWTAGPSQVDGNGAYSWYKIAGASEPSSVTFTPSVSDFICAGLIEYHGAYATAAASLDAQNSSLHSGTVVSTTNSASVTPSTWSDLIIGIACLHKFNANTVDPTAPVWTGGLSNVQAQGVGARTVKSCWTYYGDNLDQGQGGATAVACSWSTQTFGDAQILVLAFKTPAKDITLNAVATTTAGTTRAAKRTAAATAATTPATTRSPARSTAASAATTAATQRQPARTTAAQAGSSPGTTRAPSRTAAATAATAPSTTRAVQRTAAASATSTPAIVRSPTRPVSATASTSSATQRAPSRTAAAAAGSSSSVQRAPGRNAAATAATSPAVSRGLTRLVDAEAVSTPDARRGPSRILAATASAAAQLLRTITRTAAATASTDAEVTATKPPPPQRLLVTGARALKRWSGRPIDRWLGREGKPGWRGREGPQ